MLVAASEAAIAKPLPPATRHRSLHREEEAVKTSPAAIERLSGCGPKAAAGARQRLSAAAA